MSQVTITSTFNRLIEAERNLAALRRVIATSQGGISAALGRRLAQAAEHSLTLLTPKRTSPRLRAESRRGYSTPIRKQWNTHVLETSASQYSAEIRNKAADNAAGLVILRSLESGAKPHKMPAAGARLFPYVFVGRFVAENAVPAEIRAVTRSRSVARSAVSFIGREIGQSITDRFFTAHGVAKSTRYATHINHPGMKGFGMVAETTRALRILARELGFQASAQITDAFARSISIERLK